MARVEVLQRIRAFTGSLQLPKWVKPASLLVGGLTSFMASALVVVDWTQQRLGGTSAAAPARMSDAAVATDSGSVATSGPSHRHAHPVVEGPPVDEESLEAAADLIKRWKLKAADHEKELDRMRDDGEATRDL